MAHLVGASREAIVDQIAEFKKTGLLATGYRSIRLTNPKGLMQILTTEIEFDISELLEIEPSRF